MSDHGYYPDGETFEPVELDELVESTPEAPLPLPVALPGVTLTPDTDTSVIARTPASAVKATAKKAIAKYIELSDASENHLRLLAAALGTKPDEVELAAVIVSSSRLNLGALTEIVALGALKDRPFDLMGAASGLTRDESKRVWALLGQMGLSSGSLASKDGAAALNISKAVVSLTSADLIDLDAVRLLGSK